jgi:hypothetical protein
MLTTSLFDLNRSKKLTLKAFTLSRLLLIGSRAAVKGDIAGRRSCLVYFPAVDSSKPFRDFQDQSGAGVNWYSHQLLAPSFKFC